MTLAKLLPLAFVMIAGPQILSAIFLATTEKWKANSAAFVVGAGAAVTVFATIGYLLSTGASDQGASKTTLNAVILVLLLAAAVHKYLTRKQSEPPKWMGKLETIQPKGALILGFLLLGVFPTDILTSLAVGGTASTGGEPWWHLCGFLFLTLFFVALPALTVLLLGEKGKVLLPKVRDWMNANSWVVSELVLALFIAMTLSNLLSS